MNAKSPTVTAEEITNLAAQSERNGGTDLFDVDYFRLVSLLNKRCRNDHAKTLRILERIGCFSWVLNDRRMKALVENGKKDAIFRAIAECPMKQKGNGPVRFAPDEFFEIAR
jgi:hypothetical protein